MENLKTVERLHQKETARIEAFSDGVFCVALTLLAIEIGVEFRTNETNEGLWTALAATWPKFAAYAISFINVLLAWMGHHGLFKYLRNTDNFVMISNGLLLLLIALVPFPAKTLGLYLLTGAYKTAILFYTGYFVAISLAFRLLWYASSRTPYLLIHTITETEIKNMTRNENLGLVANAVIFAVSFFSPWFGLILSFLMWIYWITLS